MNIIKSWRQSKSNGYVYVCAFYLTIKSVQRGNMQQQKGEWEITCPVLEQSHSRIYEKG